MEQHDEQVAPAGKSQAREMISGAAYLLVAALSFLVIYLNHHAFSFTLVEVLIAMVLFTVVIYGTAIGLGFLFSAVSTDSISELKNDALDYPL